MKQIMNNQDVARNIEKLARALAKKHNGEALCLVGILTAGYPLAQRLAEVITRLDGRRVDVGKLDVSLYRDDLSTQGSYITIQASDIPFDVNGRTVVLVDDVIYKGRTIRAALDGIHDYGRPAKIELAVLIDRGQRELPIEPNFVAEKIEVADGEVVQVDLSTEDGQDRVTVIKR